MKNIAFQKVKHPPKINFSININNTVPYQIGWQLTEPLHLSSEHTSLAFFTIFLFSVLVKHSQDWKFTYYSIMTCFTVKIFCKFYSLQNLFLSCYNCYAYGEIISQCSGMCKGKTPQVWKHCRKFVTFVVELSLVNRRELLRGSAFGGAAIVGLNTWGVVLKNKQHIIIKFLVPFWASFNTILLLC